MTENTRMKRRLRSAIAGVCLATTLAGIAACADETPSESRTSGSARPSPTSRQPDQRPSDSAAGPALRMIRNGDHRLAFHVTPGRTPALVLDAGGGADSSYWTELAATLAKRTGSMVVTYDRAGMGKSDEVPGPWRVEDAVSDLETGLRELGLARDVVLVAHSQAAEVATYFAREDPEGLAGAVLVDASLPAFYTDAQIARIEAANEAQAAAVEDQPETRQARQSRAIAANYGPMHRAYHKVSWPGRIPAVAIVSERTPFDTPRDADRWRDAHRTFADAAANRSLLTAENSSHDIAEDRPDVIVRAVEGMLRTVR